MSRLALTQTRCYKALCSGVKWRLVCVCRVSASAPPSSGEFRRCSDPQPSLRPCTRRDSLTSESNHTLRVTEERKAREAAINLHTRGTRPWGFYSPAAVHYPLKHSIKHKLIKHLHSNIKDLNFQTLKHTCKTFKLSNG